MIAINHAMTGAIIGLTVHNPVVAVVVALLSHLVCDMIPHFGADAAKIKTTAFAAYLVIDALLCVLLVSVLLVSGVSHWLLAAVCAFVATAPDFIWIRRFVAARHNTTFHPNRLEMFLKRIQWFERPSGAVVELVWAAGAITILSNIL